MRIAFLFPGFLAGLLMGCASRSPDATAMARTHPFIVALNTYHRDTGDYPKELADLYPRYLGTNVLWYQNKDPKHVWLLNYEKAAHEGYRLYLYSSPCSEAIFQNDRFLVGIGPNYSGREN